MTGIQRSITHWTAGGGRASSVDKKHYHKITEHDGTIVLGNEKIEDNIVTSDGDYAAHVLNLNTGSAGFAMAGMLNAVEVPFSPGPQPINEKQFEAHCKMLAEFHQAYGIPVTQKTCLTHAEVEPTLGIKQRGKWDITRLVFKPQIRGAIPVGDYMRERVKSYMTNDSMIATQELPIIRYGDRGPLVRGLQQDLDSFGYPVGDIDGKFGELTRDAVLAFQADMGIPTDGVVGTITWGAFTRANVRRPRQHVDVSDLRKRGSETIKKADSAETVAKGTAAVTTVAGGTQLTLDAMDKVAGAQSSFSAISGMVAENLPLILIICAGAVAFFVLPRIMKQIKDRRVDDHNTGANRGR